VNKIVPLCPTVCCCPEIKFKNKEFIITDDYEGKIIIPEESIDDLIKQLDETLSMLGNSLDS
jgi:hypothetical protein